MRVFLVLLEGRDGQGTRCFFRSNRQGQFGVRGLLQNLATIGTTASEWSSANV